MSNDVTVHWNWTPQLTWERKDQRVRERTHKLEIARSGSRSCDPRVTFATVHHGEFTGTGASHVDEHDEFDQETGDLLAVGRAYADLARQMKRAGWNRVHTTSKMAAGEAGAAAVKELLGIVPPVGAVVTADLTAPKPALKKRKRIGRMRRDVGHTY